MRHLEICGLSAFHHLRAVYKVRHMENNNESKPVTRAHLFARIDATLLPQPPRVPAQSEPSQQQNEEPPEAVDAE
ncbi:hypothetical protein [Achromobacter sp. UBA4530]|uniref:hypothetical protein n=1 Tax=Achromobacter sp. UBA4530 TaxID=1945912 RepID=UPI0025803964|nr:hypothetical protein [Achromobacter sp. UBA4530]